MEKKKRARTKLVTTGKEELNNEKSQINKRKRTKKSENFVEKLTAKNAPQAIGPYSIATRVNVGNKDMIFCSGFLGMDPATGNLVDDTIEGQTKQIFENMKAVLEENQSSLEQVSKTTVFLADMNEFKKMNEIYASYFNSNLPARSTIEIKALPKPGAKVEIECIAFSSKKK